MSKEKPDVEYLFWKMMFFLLCTFICMGTTWFLVYIGAKGGLIMLLPVLKLLTDTIIAARKYGEGVRLDEELVSKTSNG